MKRSLLIEAGLGNLPIIEPMSLPGALSAGVALDCLRLDKIHPFISGNKWYKLQHHLLAAQSHQKKSIVSFGGAFSNHLHALAYAGHEFSFSTVGIIRGERPESLSPTLLDCEKWGMKLEWMSREQYRQHSRADHVAMMRAAYPDAWIIPEGGEGARGLAGIEALFRQLYHAHDLSYQLIVCPVGSGTTLAGIAMAVGKRAQCLGYSALKGAHDLECRVEQMLGHSQRPVGKWQICHDFHFGGFAKRNARLTDFISSIHERSGMLLDPIYTGKMMYGLCEWIKQGRINTGARILVVHTGGLQGWRGMGGGPA